MTLNIVTINEQRGVWMTADSWIMSADPRLADTDATPIIGETRKIFVHPHLPVLTTGTGDLEPFVDWIERFGEIDAPHLSALILEVNTVLKDLKRKYPHLFLQVLYAGYDSHFDCYRGKSINLATLKSTDLTDGTTTQPRLDGRYVDDSLRRQWDEASNGSGILPFHQAVANAQAQALRDGDYPDAFAFGGELETVWLTADADDGGHGVHAIRTPFETVAATFVEAAL